MSDLHTVVELLEKNCFCHSSEVKYMLECMPTMFKQRVKVSSDCSCFHAQEKEIKQALLQFKTFMETKGQFKVGDQVELNFNPVINSQVAWGWMSSRHFLIEGAKAIVKDISYRSNEFVYYLVFDNDVSWIDDKDVIHPYKSPSNFDKNIFCFREAGLRKVNSSPCAFLKTLWSEFYKIGD